MTERDNLARDPLARVSEYLSDELTPDARADVREWVEEDADGAESLEQMAQVLQLFDDVRAAGPPPVPPDFYRQVRRKLRRRAAARRGLLGLPGARLFGVRVPFELFAAFVLVTLSAVAALVAPQGMMADADSPPPSASRLGPTAALLDLHLVDPTTGRAVLRNITNELGGRILTDDRPRATRLYVALPLRGLADYIRQIKAAPELDLVAGAGSVSRPTDLRIEVRLDDHDASR